jgi:hypothetical protein
VGEEGASHLNLIPSSDVSLGHSMLDGRCLIHDINANETEMRPLFESGYYNDGTRIVRRGLDRANDGVIQKDALSEEDHICCVHVGVRGLGWYHSFPHRQGHGHSQD